MDKTKPNRAPFIIGVYQGSGPSSHVRAPLLCCNACGAVWLGGGR